MKRRGRCQSGTPPGAEESAEPAAPARIGTSGLPRARLERLAEIEASHFWFAGRRSLVSRMLRRHGPPRGSRLLDLGCGTGHTGTWLRGLGFRVVGLDSRAGDVRSGSQAIALVRGDSSRLPYLDGAFDGVVLLDVLEHVDDVATLLEVTRVLVPGGVVVATVPATPWLWSHRDVAAGHLRRYTTHTLGQAVSSGGLEVTALHHFQFLLFPAVVVSRWLGRRGPALRDAEDAPPTLLNQLLRPVSLLDAQLAGRVPSPWGASLAVVARAR